VVWPEPGALDDATRTELARAAGVCLMESDGDVFRRITATRKDKP